MERRKTIALITAGTVLLGGCTANKNNGPVETSTGANDMIYPLNAGQPVYPSPEAASAREEACATLEAAADVTAVSTHDVGASLVLKLATSGISDNLTSNNCPTDFVYANFK